MQVLDCAQSVCLFTRFTQLQHALPRISTACSGVSFTGLPRVRRRFFHPLRNHLLRVLGEHPVTRRGMPRLCSSHADIRSSTPVHLRPRLPHASPSRATSRASTLPSARQSPHASDSASSLPSIAQVHFDWAVADQLDVVEPHHSLRVPIHGGIARADVGNRLADRLPHRAAPACIECAHNLFMAPPSGDVPQFVGGNARQPEKDSDI